MIEQIQSMLSNTEHLAAWGAITGSVGTLTGALSLYLRFRQQKRDQAKLKCAVEITHEHYNNPMYRIVVRSIGRRPVTIDHIQYKMAPLEFPKRILRWYKWLNNDWIHKVEPNNLVTLTEGTRQKIPIDPKRVSIKYVYAVNVVDQTNRAWNVKWPSSKEISRLTHYKELHDQKEENNTRLCSLSGCEYQDKFRLTVRWNVEDGKKNTLTSKTYSFNSLNEYSKKYSDLTKTTITKFMNDGERDF